LKPVVLLSIACLASSLQAEALAPEALASETPASETPAESRREQAVTLAVDGQYQQALSIFLDLVREAPDDPALNYYTGLTLVRLKRVGEGMSYFERSIRQKAPFPQPYVELAGLYLDKKLRTEAARIVEQGLQLFPKHKPLLALKQRLEEEKQ